ncbi:hypothetical protein DBR06_SOUSAS44410019, partial [Sousa chinensis]
MEKPRHLGKKETGGPDSCSPERRNCGLRLLSPRNGGIQGPELLEDRGPGDLDSWVLNEVGPGATEGFDKTKPLRPSIGLVCHADITPT